MHKRLTHLCLLFIICLLAGQTILANPPVNQNIPAPQNQQRDVSSVDKHPALGVHTSPDFIPPRSPISKKQPKPYPLANKQSLVCEATDFAALSGNDLVEAVRGADLSCINNLFSVTGSLAYDLFNEDKMVMMAQGMTTYATQYPGNNTEGLEQIVLYLRAGYYVQFYHSDDVGDYGPALESGIQVALDAYTNNSHFLDVSDEHGQILGEAITLIDSAGQNARYLLSLNELLNQYNQDYLDYWYMNTATNNIFIVYFRGHYQSDFVDFIQQNQAPLQVLIDFTANTWLIGTDEEYILANDVRELGRFLQYEGVIRDMVKPVIIDILNQYSLTGPGAALWIAAAEMADYHDPENCADYGVCNLAEIIAETILPIQHQCSSTLKIRAQDVNGDELQQICQDLGLQETEFHQQLATNNTPVANDLNEDLEVVIFDSYDDYQTYAGILFGISTNNGGMYLEGNPADPNNQARFIAHEATWLPDFQVWNLEHEYVHYLDGRFDMQGGFNDYLTANTVWWLEGLAEYVALGDDNQAAIDQGVQKTYQLSEIFQNDYNSGVDRIYRWGYLAVRFMFEQHPGEVSTILAHFRAGNYATYQSYMDNIGSSYNAEFHTWIDCTANPTCTPPTPTPTPTVSVTPVTPTPTTPPNAEYCTANQGMPDSEHITEVQVGDINNTSTHDDDGYSDYTNYSAELVIGQSYPISVQVSNSWSTSQFAIWIDWNNDLDFDDVDEMVVHTIGSGPYNNTLSPPVGASSGPTRMRLRLVYDSTPQPCGQAWTGEVEDYTIEVVDPNPTVTPSPTGTATPTPTPTASTTPTATSTTNPTTTPTATGTPLPNALLYLDPASQTVSIADGEFCVETTIAGAIGLGGFEFTLDFPADKLQATSVNLGPFLESTGRSVVTVGPDIDNTSGNLAYGAVSMGHQAGPTGEGILATLCFEPQEAGTASLDLITAQLTDEAGHTLPVVMSNSIITIEGCYWADVDCDEDVDIVDIQLVAAHWDTQAGDATYDPLYDLDDNNQVDVLDVQLAASQWRWPDLPSSPGTLTVNETPLSFSIDSNSTLLGVGQTKRIGLWVSDAQTLGAFELNLAYDPEMLQVNQVILPNFLGGTEQDFIPLGPKIDNQIGAVRFGGATINNTTGLNGDEIIAWLDVVPLKAGQSQLNFSSSQATTPNATQLPVTAVDWSYTIQHMVYLPLILTN